MENNNSSIFIEVVYADKTSYKLIGLSVPRNTSVRKAIKLSGILDEFPELLPPYESETLKVGVFSRFKSPDDILESNDRVEIYRELLIDPKDARRLKAKVKN